MIFFILCWGLVMVIFDVAFFPTLFAFQLSSDFTLFYVLSIMLVFNNESFFLALALSLLKALLIFPDQWMLYLFSFLFCFLIAFAFRKNISQARFFWIILLGSLFLVFQMIWVGRFSFSEMVWSTLLHVAIWSFLSPQMYRHYERKLKLYALRKGSAV